MHVTVVMSNSRGMCVIIFMYSRDVKHSRNMYNSPILQWKTDMSNMY